MDSSDKKSHSPKPSTSSSHVMPSPSSSCKKRKGSPVKMERDPLNKGWKRQLKLEDEQEEMSDPMQFLPDIEEFIEKEQNTEKSATKKDTNHNPGSIITRCRNLLDKVSQLLKRNLPPADDKRIQIWNQKLRDLRDKSTEPAVTTIAVVGDTGAGKSSLINALLDHADILPTSCFRACTAVVVEVTGNTSGDQYEADIEFLSEEEWANELSKLRSTLTDYNGITIKVSKKDLTPDENVALDKVKAVYGPPKDGISWEEYTLKNSVTEGLSQPSRSVNAKTQPEELRDQIEYYIQSTGDENGGEFWPVVRNVRIRIPDCDICRDGAVLVDLPGTRDSNEARNKVAKNYIRHCDSMWVVANINRAIDDKTAKDMLSYLFDNQASMDGHYRTVSFICTHTDQIRIREVTRSFALPEDVRQIQGRIQEKEGSIKNLKKECKDLESSIKRIQRDLGNPDNLTSSTEEDDKLALKKNELERKEAEKSEEEKRLGFDKRNLKLACIKARNAYCTDKIKRNFRERLRLLKGSPGKPDDEEDIYEYRDTEEDIDDQEDDTAQDRRVFCVSASEYLRMTGKIEDEDLPQIMGEIDDTEVPQVRHFVQEMTSKRQREKEKELIIPIRSLVEDVWGCIDGGWVVCELRKEATPTYDRLVEELHHNLLKLKQQLEEQIKNVIDNQLIPKLKRGAGKAAAEAENTQRKWGSKEIGGYAWNTYRTVCHGDGEYQSHTYGEINFNMELADPMYSSIENTWDKLFHDCFETKFEKFKDSTLKAARRFAATQYEKLEAFGICDDKARRCCLHHLNSTYATLTQFVNELIKLIEVRKKEIGPVLVEKVKNEMLPAYRKCKDEIGGGMFGRMKEHMGRHIRTEKINIFHESPEAMIQEIKLLQEKVSAGLQKCTETVISDTKRIYQPFWKTTSGSISETLNEEYLKEAVKCKRMMEKLCEDANIPDVELTRSSTRAMETP